MIVNKKALILAVGVLAATATACSSDADIPKGASSVLVDPAGEQSDFDQWLGATFLDPYNIEVKYRLNDNESNFSYHLAPAALDKSIQLAHLLDYLCLKPYDAVTGSTSFIRDVFPKEVQFIGSPAYNPNGTQILGVAEGGRRMLLYEANSLNPQDVDHMTEHYFHTVHHEFGHIQNQTKPFPATFRQLTGGTYTGDSWSRSWGTPAGIRDSLVSGLTTANIQNYRTATQRLSVLQPLVNAGTATAAQQTEATQLTAQLATLRSNAQFQQDSAAYDLLIKYLGGTDLSGRTYQPVFTTQEINALRAGYVSPYASNTPEEDFVEVQSFYITESPEKFQVRMLISGTGTRTAEGGNMLQEKLRVVQTYLRDQWSIDLRRLQAEVQRRQNNLPSVDQLNSLTINR